MPASVTHLLDNLEARLSEAKAELATLRDENQRLKRRLEAPAAQASTAPATSQPAPAEVTTDEAERGAQPEAPSPQALLKQWYERYPQAFVSAHTRPLKVGIHEDLAHAVPWSNKLIRRALAHYVNLPRYIKALREGTPRVDLSGSPAGTVDKAAAQAAMEKRRRQEANAKRSATERKVTPSKGHARNRPVTKRQQAEKIGAPPANPAPRAALDHPEKNAANPQDQAPAKPPEDMQSKLASLQRHFGQR